MVDIIHHDPRDFERWMSRLARVDQRRILRKLHMLAHVGSALSMPSVRRLGGGLSELRVDKYRVYFTIEGDEAWILGHGTKDTQQRDIARARRRR